MATLTSIGTGAAALLVGLVVVLGVAEDHRFRASVQTRVDVSDVARAVLTPAPIPAALILEGHPDTQAAEIAHSDDGSTKVYVWRTTSSRFRWDYESDEITTVLDGEAFIDDGHGRERRLGPGDVAFFPAGMHTVWRVPAHFHNMAVLKRVLPSPVANLIRWMRAAKALMAPSFASAVP